MSAIDINDITLENINKQVLRYIELREIYSSFDENGNPNMLPIKDENYKPLINSYFKNFDSQVEWIIPIINNVREIIVDKSEKSDIYHDDDYLQIVEYNQLVSSVASVIDNWKSKSSKPCDIDFI